MAIAPSCSEGTAGSWQSHTPTPALTTQTQPRSCCAQSPQEHLLLWVFLTQTPPGPPVPRKRFSLSLGARICLVVCSSQTPCRAFGVIWGIGGRSGTQLSFPPCLCTLDTLTSHHSIPQTRHPLFHSKFNSPSKVGSQDELTRGHSS